MAISEARIRRRGIVAASITCLVAFSVWLVATDVASHAGSERIESPVEPTLSERRVIESTNEEAPSVEQRSEMAGTAPQADGPCVREAEPVVAPWRLSDAPSGRAEEWYLKEAERRGIRIENPKAVSEIIDGLATGAAVRDIELDLTFEDVDVLRPIAEAYYPRILELLARRRQLVDELTQADGSFVPTSEWRCTADQLTELTVVVTQGMRERLPQTYWPCIIVY